MAIIRAAQVRAISIVYLPHALSCEHCDVQWRIRSVVVINKFYQSSWEIAKGPIKLDGARFVSA
jgi:hypothetical protein